MLAFLVLIIIIWAIVRYDRGPMNDSTYIRRPYLSFSPVYDSSLLALILIVVLFFVLSGHGL